MFRVRPTASSARRPGLTLMELIVVMAILMALASIMIPLYPSLLGRAHKASESTNLNELNKAIQMYQALNNAYPDGYDLLGDGTALAAYLPGNTLTATTADTTTTVGGLLNPAALTTGHLAALNAAGVTQGYPMAIARGAEPFTPTFNPYSSATPVPLSTSTKVAFVNPAGILRAKIMSDLNVGSSNTQFVLFGIGSRCSLIGATMGNAPNLYPDSPDENPANFYERYGVIFQVEDVNGNPLGVAKFIGAVAIEADGIEGVDADLESYYQKFGK